MREYSNYYDREWISLNGWDLLENYEIQRVINDARNDYPQDIKKQCEIVKRTCHYYWPPENIDDFSIEIRKRAGLPLDANQNIMKDESGEVTYQKFLVNLSQVSVEVKAFYYEDKRWFYWWDMYKGAIKIKSGLEFFPYRDHPASYLIFATDETQSPILCTKDFKNIRLE